jgi:hypothetical protein
VLLDTKMSKNWWLQAILSMSAEEADIINTLSDDES